MIKKLICFTQILILLFQLFSIATVCADNEVFSSGCISIETSKDVTANLYSDNITSGFFVKIRNPENIVYQVSMNSVVVNENSETVWESNTSDFDLEKNATVYKNLTPKVFDYGTYMLTTTVSGDFGEFSVSKKFAVSPENEIRADDIGACLHFDLSHYRERTTETEYLTENAGIGWVRDDLRWANVERAGSTEKYVIPPNRKNEIDSLIASGNKVLLVLAYDNYEVYGELGLPTDEKVIQAYADYCAYVAQYYKGKIDAFEIWNEPDNSGFTNGLEKSGADYAKVLKAAYTAIKKVNPEAKVIAGAFCSFVNRNAHAREVFEEFIEVSDIVNYMDAFSWHPYDGSGNGTIPDEITDNLREVTILEQFRYAKEKFSQKGKPDMPLWLTEYGFSTTNDGTFYTYDEQASCLIKSLLAVKSEPQVARTFVYNLRAIPDGAVNERNFGITETDYTPKPAYVALAQMNNILADTEFGDRYADDTYNGRSFSAYRFLNENKTVFAMWEHTYKAANVQILIDETQNNEIEYSEENGNAVITIPYNKKACFYDIYGNMMISGGEILYNLTSEPVYIEITDKAHTEIQREGNIVTVSGYSENVETDVTLLAIDKNQGSRIVAINQQKSDVNGKFTFNIALPEKEACLLYVFDGNMKKSLEHVGKVNITDVKYYINDTPAQTFDEVKNGDIIKAVLTIGGNKNLFDSLIFYGAVYGSNCMNIYDLKNVVWKDNSGTAEITITIDDESDFKALKLFLWDTKMKPMINHIEINR